GPRQPPPHLGPLHLRRLGPYPGSLGHFAGKHRAVPIVTVELPYAGIMPSDAEIRKIWIDLVRWLRINIHQGASD
ncbi:MAG: murein peptide amidase A, partial [Gammaproteobacteria bacterium]|nr:murein peptide amidase A [Gammaproteobacteria bacterium]